MITVRLWGGLGNQMFQYATGRCLARRLGADLQLDVSHFRREWLRRYALGNFNIRAGTVRSSPPAAQVYRDRFGEFHAGVLTAPDGSFLEGNWHSPRYFEEIRDVLLEEFTPRIPLAGRNAAIAEQIKSCEAVCVTVRRGDYVTVPRVQAYYGVLPPEYYQRAAEILAARVSQPVFFVFADDHRWAKRRLCLPGPTVFVDHNYTHRHSFLEKYAPYRFAHRLLHRFRPDRSWMDLHLCRMCRHFIIANSTFSWWGAWLGAVSDSLVFAPGAWFNPRRRQDPARSREDKAVLELLLPSAWRRM